MDSGRKEAPAAGVTKNVFGLNTGEQKMVRDCPKYLVHAAATPTVSDVELHPRPYGSQPSSPRTTGIPLINSSTKKEALGLAPTLTAGRDSTAYLRAEVLSKLHPTMERVLESHIAMKLEESQKRLSASDMMSPLIPALKANLTSGSEGLPMAGSNRRSPRSSISPQPAPVVVPAAPSTQDPLFTIATELKGGEFPVTKVKSFNDATPPTKEESASTYAQQQQTPQMLPPSRGKGGATISGGGGSSGDLSKKKKNNTKDDGGDDGGAAKVYKYNFGDCTKPEHMKQQPFHQCGPYTIFTSLSPTTKELDVLCKRITEDNSSVKTILFIQLLSNEVLFFNGVPHTGRGALARLQGKKSPVCGDQGESESPEEVDGKEDVLDVTRAHVDVDDDSGYSFTKSLWSKQTDAIGLCTDEAMLAALELPKCNVNTPTEVYSEAAERQHIAARILTVPAPCFINSGNLHVFDHIHKFLLQRGTNAYEEGSAVVLCTYEPEQLPQLQSLAMIPVTLTHSLSDLRRMERLQRAAVDSLDPSMTHETNAADRVKMQHDKLLVRRKARGEKRKERAAEQMKLMKEVKKQEDAEEAAAEAALLATVGGSDGTFSPEDGSLSPPEEALSSPHDTSAKGKEKDAKMKKLRMLREKTKRAEKRREWRHEEQELNYQRLVFKEVRDASIKIQSIFRGHRARTQHAVKTACDHHTLFEATQTQFNSARSTVIDGDFANLKLMNQHLVDVDSALFTTDRPVKAPPPRTFARLRQSSKRVPAQYDGDISSEDEVVEEVVFATRAPPVAERQLQWNPYFQLLRCMDFVGGFKGLKWLEEVHQQYAGVPAVVKRAFAVLEEHTVLTYYCAFVALSIRGKLSDVQEEQPSNNNSKLPPIIGLGSGLGGMFGARPEATLFNLNVTPKKWMLSNCAEILQYFAEPSLSSRCVVGSAYSQLSSSGPTVPFTPHHTNPPVAPGGPVTNNGSGIALKSKGSGLDINKAKAVMPTALAFRPVDIRDDGHAPATRGMKLVVDTPYSGLWSSFGRASEDTEELSPGVWRLCKNAPVYICYDPLPYEEWKRAITAVAQRHDEPPEELDGMLARKKTTVTWISTVAQPVVHVGDSTYLCASVNGVDKVVGADGKEVTGPALHVLRGVEVKRVDPVSTNMTSTTIRHGGSFGAQPPARHNSGRRRSSQQGLSVAIEAALLTHGTNNGGGGGSPANNGGVGFAGDKTFDESTWLKGPNKVPSRASLFGGLVSMVEWEHSLAMAVIKHLEESDGMLHRLVRLNTPQDSSLQNSSRNCLKHITRVSLMKHEHRVVKTLLQPKPTEPTRREEERAQRASRVPTLQRMKSVAASASMMSDSGSIMMAASFIGGSGPPPRTQILLPGGGDAESVSHSPQGDSGPHFSDPLKRRGTVRNPNRPSGEPRSGSKAGLAKSRRGSDKSMMSTALGPSTARASLLNNDNTRQSITGQANNTAATARGAGGKVSITSMDINTRGSKSVEVELPQSAKQVVRPHGAVWDQLRDELLNDGVNVNYARVPLMGGTTDLAFLSQIDSFLSAIRTSLLPSDGMPGEVGQGSGVVALPAIGRSIPAGAVRAGGGPGTNGNLQAEAPTAPDFVSPLVIGVSHHHHTFFATLVGVVVGVRAQWEVKVQAQKKKKADEDGGDKQLAHLSSPMGAGGERPKSSICSSATRDAPRSGRGRRPSGTHRDEENTELGDMGSVSGEPQIFEDGGDSSSPQLRLAAIPAVQQLLAVFPDCAKSVQFFNEVLLVQTTSAAALLAECHRSLTRQDIHTLNDAERRLAIVEGVLRSEELVLLLLIHYYLLDQIECAEDAPTGTAICALTVLPSPSTTKSNTPTREQCLENDDESNGDSEVLPTLGNFFESYPTVLEWWRTLDPWAVPQAGENWLETQDDDAHQEESAFSPPQCRKGMETLAAPGGSTQTTWVSPDPLHVRYSNSYMRRRVYQEIPTVFM